MTYDTKGIFKCYEIKISKPDFDSKAHHTFLGHYNYYVMTNELYQQIKDKIPNHIGVFIEDKLVKRAKKQALAINGQILKDSLIRSLSREAEKVIKNNNPTILEDLEKRVRKAENEAKKYYEKYWDLMRIGQKKYGSRWYTENN